MLHETIKTQVAHRAYIWFMVLIALATSGCGEAGPNRYHVSGTVSFEGQPVPAGLVMFDPDVSSGNNGPQGFALIHDGVFNTADTGGKGPVAGPHRIRVSGYDGTQGNEAQPYGQPIFAEYVFPHTVPSEDSAIEIVVSR